MKKYRCILFDLDGTLLNTIEDLTDSVNYVMRRYHFPVKTVAQVTDYVGNGIRKLMERCVPEGAACPLFEEVFQAFREYYTEHCQIKTRPYDGIITLLNHLKDEGYKMAIVSNKNQQAVEELCAFFFRDYISVAIGQSDAVLPKPAPDTVFEAMKRLGCSVQETLYVGDSDVDSATAGNAGLDCVLVSWGFRRRELLESLQPLRVIDAPGQLLEVLAHFA